MDNNTLNDNVLSEITGGNEGDPVRKEFVITYIAANGTKRFEEIGPFKTKTALDKEIVSYRRVLKAMGCKNIVIKKTE